MMSDEGLVMSDEVKKKSKLESVIYDEVMNLLDVALMGKVEGSNRYVFDRRSPEGMKTVMDTIAGGVAEAVGEFAAGLKRQQGSGGNGLLRSKLLAELKTEFPKANQMKRIKKCVEKVF